MRRSWPVGFLAAGIGAAVWLLVRIPGGGDPVRTASLYLWLGWPAIVLASFFLGWAFPERPWRWPAAALGTEVLLRLAAARGVGDPRELVLLALVAVPCVAAAWLGAAAGSPADPPGGGDPARG
jgi:hypothetical protein